MRTRQFKNKPLWLKRKLPAPLAVQTQAMKFRSYASVGTARPTQFDSIMSERRASRRIKMRALGFKL